MWLKVALLTLLLLSLFVLSRILEATLFLESGFWSNTILDPVSMSVRQLKRILETRGICYSSVLEKHELSALVESSGQVMDGELRDSLFESLAEAEGGAGVVVGAEGSGNNPSTRFTCGSHFYEDVEDTKDSAWLIQVVPDGDDDTPLLDDLNWRRLVAKVRPFGIRTGWLDCRLDRRLCRQKNWHRPQVVLALPRGSRAKDSVVFRSIGGAARTESAVTHWLRQQLNSRVRLIHSVDELERSWLKFGDYNDDYIERVAATSEPKVRVVMMVAADSALANEPPLFFSALSMKFAGRVSFGLTTISTSDLPFLQDLKSNANRKSPTFLVATPEGVVVYGQRTGEHLNFRSLEFFLRTLQPEMNDLFLVTLGVANVLALMDVFLVRSSGWWRHLARLSWTIAKYNGALFLAWLSVFGLARFDVVDAASDWLLRVARSTATNPVVALCWQDVRFWRSTPLALALAGLLTCAAHAYLRIRWWVTDDATNGAATGVATETDANGNVERAATPPAPPSFSLDSYIMNCFFRPIASSDVPADVDLTEFLLIEHLVTPNLWLRPVVSNSSYVEDLPVWRYRCRDEIAPVVRPTDDDCDGSRRNCEEDCEGDDDEDYLSSCTSDGGSTSANEARVVAIGSVCTRRRSFPSSSSSSLERDNRLIAGPCVHHHEEPMTTTRIEPVSWRDSLARFADDKWTTLAKQCRRVWNVIRRRLSGRTGGGRSRAARRITNRVPDGVLVSQVCAICLDPYVHRDVLCGLPCGHNFHHHCILSWLVRDNHHCPICRWPSYKQRPISARPAELPVSTLG